jgi:hypothetical protein
MEQKLAQEALRLADREVDWAFAAALHEAAENPPPLSAKAKQIQDRVAKAQKALDFDTAQVAFIAAAAAKASGPNKDQLNENLTLMKSQMELDQNEVDDAKQDLIRAGGDPQARIQQLVQEHDAASHNTPTATPAPPPNAGRGLISLYRDWSALHQKEGQLQAAQQAAVAAVAKISSLHDALEAKVDSTKSQQANVEDPEASTLLSTTKRLSDSRKALSSYDKRIDSHKELAQVYGNWLLLVDAKERRIIHSGLISLAIVLGIMLVGLFFDDWFERLLLKASARPPASRDAADGNARDAASDRGGSDSFGDFWNADAAGNFPWACGRGPDRCAEGFYHRLPRLVRAHGEKRDKVRRLGGN